MIDTPHSNDSNASMTISLSLQEVNDIYATYRIGGIIFVSIMMIVGTIGNSHVLYIYIRKFPKSNRRLYLVCLGVLDLTACTVAMPSTIIELRYPLVLDNMIALCKVRVLLKYFICCAAGLLLVVIAYDRYCKICHPMRQQISNRRAKWLCVIAMLISGMFTWPAAVLFGRRTFPTHFGVDGVICSTKDIYNNYMLCFNLALVILLSVAGSALILFYVKIGWKIFKHKEVTTKLTTSTKKLAHEDSVETGIELLSDRLDSPIGAEDDESFCTVQDLTANVPKRSKRAELRDTVRTRFTLFREFFRRTIHFQPGCSANTQKDGQSISAKRTTVMLMIITVIYIASYVPYLVLTSILLSRHDYLESLSFTALSMYFTFLWCFFINNMINPIIYTICDQRYRRQLTNMYSFCCPSHQYVN